MCENLVIGTECFFRGRHGNGGGELLDVPVTVPTTSFFQPLAQISEPAMQSVASALGHCEPPAPSSEHCSQGERACPGPEPNGQVITSHNGRETMQFPSSIRGLTMQLPRGILQIWMMWPSCRGGCQSLQALLDMRCDKGGMGMD